MVGGDGSGGNASDGERQMKLRSLARWSEAQGLGTPALTSPPDDSSGG